VVCHRWEATTDATAVAPPPPPPPPLPPPPSHCPMDSQDQEPQDATVRHHPTGKDLDLSELSDTQSEVDRSQAKLFIPVHRGHAEP
jgi:hypothetical protein